MNPVRAQYWTISSDNGIGDLPTGFISLGHYSVTALVHHTSSYPTRCLAHLHFILGILLPMTSTFIFGPISIFGTRSIRESPKIKRSFALLLLLLIPHIKIFHKYWNLFVIQSLSEHRINDH